MHIRTPGTGAGEFERLHGAWTEEVGKGWRRHQSFWRACTTDVHCPPGWRTQEEGWGGLGLSSPGLCDLKDYTQLSQAAGKPTPSPRPERDWRHPASEAHLPPHLSGVPRHWHQPVNNSPQVCCTEEGPPHDLSILLDWTLNVALESNLRDLFSSPQWPIQGTGALLKAQGRSSGSPAGGRQHH